MKLIRTFAARSALLSCAFFATSHFAKAADPTPAPFLRISAASIETLNQFVSDLNIPEPLTLQKSIEDQFPFISHGGIDTTKPIGMYVVAGENLTPSASYIFALPLVPRESTVFALTKLGGVYAENSTDTLIFKKEVAVRRTADYLFMYAGDPLVLKPLANDLFSGDYTIPATLFRLEYDAAVARDIAPVKTEAFFKNLRTTGASLSDPLYENNRLATQEFLAALLEKIDHAAINLTTDKSTIHMTGVISPSVSASQTSYPMPVFPPDAFAVIHIIYPPEMVRQQKTPDVFFSSTILKELNRNLQLTPDQTSAAKNALEKVTRLYLAPSQQSIAITTLDDHPLFLFVNQYDQDPDFVHTAETNLAILAHLINYADGLSPKLTIERLTTKNKIPSLRITLATTPPLYITAAQHRRATFFAISLSPLTDLPTMDLHRTATLTNILTAHVDLESLAKVLPAFDYQPDHIDSLPKLFAEKSLDLQIKSDSSALTFTLDAPYALVAQIARPLLRPH